MIIQRLIAIASCVIAGTACAQALPEPDPARAWREIGELVRERFHDPEINGLDWDDVTQRTAKHLEQNPENGPAIIRDSIALLEDGHTKYFTPEDRAYYELLDVFYPDGVNGHPVLPDGERVQYIGVGVVSAKIDGRIFAADVYPGGPAYEAGMRVGDELISANGLPWSDIRPFLNRADQEVPIEIRRQAGGPVQTLQVAPRVIQPRDMFLSSIEHDAQIIERDGFRLAYIRARSHAHPSYSDLVAELLTGRFGSADGLIFDFRGGWGGQSMNFLQLLNPLYPQLEFVARDGERHAWRVGWSKPVVGVIDRGSRSSKDILAYVFKKRAGYTLVGETTAGAVTGGGLFVLADGSILYLGVLDFRVDGKRLEGKGIEPDVPVARPIPYAAGDDPQMDAAVDELARQLRQARSVARRP